jgi:hypothetical protein
MRAGGRCLDGGAPAGVEGEIKLVAFDLEIAREIPDGERDWGRLGPLGITCAAAACDGLDLRVWQGRPQLGVAECQQLVRDLEQLVTGGHTLVTWNGCQFDLAVLAQESRLSAECARLALDHVDLMVMVTFSQGFFLGLQKALLGAGLAGKLQQVTRADGRVVRVEGRLAPQLWAEGEYEAVLAYLKGDVESTLALARTVERERAIRWTSGRGRRQEARFERLLTVCECFDLPPPDVSWMSNPPRRRQFVAWMPRELTAGLSG